MKGTGRRLDPDSRDDLFRMKAALPGPADTHLPVRRKWRYRGPIFDQHATSTCVGHAWKYFLMAEPIGCNSPGHPPSPYDIYDEACKLDNFTDNDADTQRTSGTSVRAGVMALRARGHISEFLWAHTVEEAMRWGLLHGPVVWGTNWYDSMFTPDAEGFLRIAPGSPLAGGHAFLTLGFDRRRSVAWGPQSWGEDFGLLGCVFYPLELLERLLHEDGECCTATETRVVPRPAAADAPRVP